MGVCFEEKNNKKVFNKSNINNDSNLSITPTKINQTNSPENKNKKEKTLSPCNLGNIKKKQEEKIIKNNNHLSEVIPIPTILPEHNEKNEVKNIKSYLEFDINKIYYIVCPDCKNTPFIKNFEYSEKINDFKVSYTCQCKNNNLGKKINLINLISDSRPTNLTNYFISKEDADKMLEIVNQHMDKFKGSKILKNLIKDNKFNQSVAPPIKANGQLGRSSRFSKSGVSTDISKSELKRSDVYHLVVSYGAEDDISYGKNNNKQIKMSPIKEEEYAKIKEYKLYKTLKEHKDKVVSLILLYSGLIATGSYDSTIRIWNVEESFCIKKLEDEGKILCLLEISQNIILFGNDKNIIGLWDLNSEENINSYHFTGHTKWVNCLAKCNDNIFASGSNDKTIKIWDYYNKKLVRTIEAHEDSIICLIRLINGNLCSGSSDLFIKIWDWNNGSCLYEIVGHENWVKCLYQLEDGTLISGSDDNTIRIWKEYENPIILRGHEHSVKALCQISDNYIASASFDDTIKIWDLKNLKCCQTLRGHKSNVSGIIKLDNNYLVSSSNDYTINVWKPNEL